MYKTSLRSHGNDDGFVVCSPFTYQTSVVTVRMSVCRLHLTSFSAHYYYFFSAFLFREKKIAFLVFLSIRKGVAKNIL